MKRLVSLGMFVVLVTWHGVLAERAAAGQPVPVPLGGKVVEASSGRSLPGVRIEAFDEGRPRVNVAPIITDSTGSYWLSFRGKTNLLYTAAGYDTVRVVYPEDLKPNSKDLESADPCVQLKNVEMTRSRKP